MKQHTSLEAYPNNPSIVTIGTFDGVHIGHQKIIERLIKAAKKKKLSSVVLTFFPHPRMVLQKDSNIKLLNTIDERKNILSSSNLDHLVIQKFTKEFANLTALEFVETILVNHLNAKHIIIGYDHHFGKNRSANIDDLKIYGKQFGFEVEEISAQDIKDVAVSSTKIRNALIKGDIKTANSYLGYNFYISGSIIKGKGIGKTINFPTANLSIKEDYKLIPKKGVYVVKCFIDSQIIFGMMNIGTNPTVGGKQQSIEVNLFNFNSNIYNKNIKVEFLKHLRGEHKFESLSLLKEQLVIDRANAKLFIENTDV
ncbi:bifunctional riboflavin kinase/FAD synthetase [Ichthyenterobacterium magnum]|uniref:Riboflavin biosynthesis protein n=1 Tax=Ichthyenterobacterium magnum TaxID=1230530 RepID=A0A420DWM4_9FLAO|nr:bifunctional riboflavin kinase/FAD synthetase [Ichthyenterobacterium magnum]RKE98613.1 riboflavin kinase/FMN adenylyltransferase [Ichthyenterobacterium magnum]